MDINSIPVISVSFNSAELIEDLLSSFRVHYENPVTIIDGSDEEHYREIKAVCNRFKRVKFIHFDYNIHHGPGMSWAFNNLDLDGPVLVLDSDISILKRGFIEELASGLSSEMYGVGYVNHVNEGGFDIDYEEGSIRYLHPACMLVNINIVRQWPMPTKHGAPMIEPMLALHRAGRSNLIAGQDWLREDFLADSTSCTRHFLRHDWQGTVRRNGSYNLDEWTTATREASEVRMCILSMLPTNSIKIVELGANDGLLSRACKEVNPSCQIFSFGSHPDKSNFQPYGDREMISRDLDELDNRFFEFHSDTDYWILDQALERSVDPLLLLSRIRNIIKHDAKVIAVVPNAQHWGIILRILIGDLRYSETGLLSKSQRHWFSRGTIFELFQQAGFQILRGIPLVRRRLTNHSIETAIRQIAECIGVDSSLTFADAQPDLYIIEAACS